MIKLTDNMLFQINKIISQYKENTDLLVCPEIIEDNKKTLYLNKQNSKLKLVVDAYNNYLNVEKELNSLNEIKDKELLEIVEKERQNLIKKLESTTQQLISLLNSQNDNYESVIVEIVGQNNGEFVDFLTSAIKNNCEINNFGYEIKVGSGGVSVYIDGNNCYAKYTVLCGLNKNNKGEILQVYVTKVLEKKRFSNNDELKIEMYRSNGAGGQNVNKLSTAIRITHTATGIVATNQDERTQLQNKQKALESIKEKVNKYYIEKEEKNVQTQKDKQKKSMKTGQVSNYFNFAKGLVVGNIETTIDDFKNGNF